MTCLVRSCGILFPCGIVFPSPVTKTGGEQRLRQTRSACMTRTSSRPNLRAPIVLCAAAILPEIGLDCDRLQGESGLETCLTRSAAEAHSPDDICPSPIRVD